MKSCLNCGKQLNEDANYCAWCGTKSEKSSQINVLTVLSVIMLIFLFLPFFPLLFMMFDAPGSQKSIFTKLFFYSMLFFPISLFMAISNPTSAKTTARYAPLLMNLIALFIGLAGIFILQGGSFVPR